MSVHWWVELGFDSLWAGPMYMHTPRGRCGLFIASWEAQSAPITPCISLLGLSKLSTTVWVTYTTEIYFLTILEVVSQRSRSQHGWFLLRLLSLACRWPSFP